MTLGEAVSFNIRKIEHLQSEFTRGAANLIQAGD